MKDLAEEQLDRILLLVYDMDNILLQMKNEKEDQDLKRTYGILFQYLKKNMLLPRLPSLSGEKLGTPPFERPSIAEVWGLHTPALYNVHNTHSRKIHAHNMHAHNTHAHNTHAHNTHAHNTHAHNTPALYNVHKTHAHNTHALYNDTSISSSTGYVALQVQWSGTSCGYQVCSSFVTQAITYFVMYKFGSSQQAEWQMMYDLAKMFLYCFNHWKLETPSVHTRSTPSDDQKAYKDNYVR